MFSLYFQGLVIEIVIVIYTEKKYILWASNEKLMLLLIGTKNIIFLGQVA